MPFFYNMTIQIAQFLAFRLAFLSPKLKNWKEGQKQSMAISRWAIKNTEKQTVNQKSIWFHVASLGEFEQGRPVIEAFKAQQPDWKIVLTFFSPSGYEIRKDYQTADLVCYLPADTPQNVRNFLDTIQPDLVCFVKYEFWYNYLTELKKRQISTVLFSAVFRPQHIFFSWYGGFFRKMLFCFDTILVQNSASQKLLRNIGYQSVQITGDTRLDRVIEIAKSVRSNKIIEDFKANDPLLIVGSAWPEDMDVLIPFLNAFEKPLKVVIAPHQIDDQQIEQWQHKLNTKSELWSQLFNSSTPQLFNSSIVFLNTIGQLSSAYQYADFAFIGGGYKDGLHNILEPAVFGMPIFFGDKRYDKFQEAHHLLANGAAQTVRNSHEMRQRFLEVYENITLRQQKGDSAKQYVFRHQGATQKVMNVLSELSKKLVIVSFFYQLYASIL